MKGEEITRKQYFRDTYETRKWEQKNRVRLNEIFAGEPGNNWEGVSKVSEGRGLEYLKIVRGGARDRDRKTVEPS